MKQLILGVLLCATVFTACNKAGLSTEEAIAVSSLPTAVAESAASNYPDAVVYSAVQVTNGPTDYILMLNTQEEVAFRASGECMGDGKGLHGDRGGHGSPFGPFGRNGMMDGHHDRDGDHGHGGCGHGIGGHHGQEIPTDSLASNIKNYISTNFGTYTIRHAELDSLCSIGGVINVALAQANTPPIRLMFEAASGNYLMQGARIEYTALPQTVQTSITTNYPNYGNRKRAIQLTLANNDLQYMVFLHQNNIRTNVLMKADGTPICTH